MRFPLECEPPVISSWAALDTPLHFCNGAAYDVPYQSLHDDFKSWFVISDCELFRLRKPHEYYCHDGAFLWLRPWHMTTYDGYLPKDGLSGYAFHVLVTGLRRSGWEPDVGAFFLEHPPHCGEWPVHYSKLATWQLLLSVALGPAFCVCQASYVTVSYAPPFHESALPSMWPLSARRAGVQGGVGGGTGSSVEASEIGEGFEIPLAEPSLH